MTELFKSSCHAGFLLLQRTNVCMITMGVSSECTLLFSNLQTLIYNHMNIEIFTNALIATLYITIFNKSRVSVPVLLCHPFQIMKT